MVQMKKDVPESVRKATRAVLLSSSSGVLLRKFCKDYRCLYGKSFPWRELGYRSPTHLLQSMPEVARFCESRGSGETKVVGVLPDRSVFVPSWVAKSAVQADCNKSSSSLRPTCVNIRPTHLATNAATCSFEDRVGAVRGMYMCM